MNDAPVLVTGGSGFVGAHVILALLAAGHRIRTTVRALGREADVRALLAKAGASPGDRLTFAAADLTRDEGWAEAVAGCRFVHHVASPFPVGAPRHEDELIVPARDGTLRVLRAAKAAGVERVVLTSSFAAIGYGHGPSEATLDEETWSNLAGDVAPYPKSKTLAERAAWEFAAAGGLGLVVVNPVGIFGPALGTDLSSSLVLLQRVVAGMPGCPRLWFGVVDVRDVADLHLRAMTHPDALGQRFLAVSGDFVSVAEIAAILKDHLGSRAPKIRTRELPDWLVRVAAWFDPALRTTLPDLGVHRNGTGAKARRVLGWSPRAPREAVTASADSLAALGLLGG
jgi:nucleoside-diphosphate-sugar epimerase